MKEVLLTYSLKISKATISVTFSPESADGRTLLAWLESLTTFPSGRDRARANRSARQESKKAKTTSATFGRSGFSSSASAALQESLANRLRERLPTAGGMMWPQTWKWKDTPALRQYCQLAVSVRRTSETDSGLWQTPRALSFDQSHQPGMNGAMASWIALWPTPQARDGEARGAQAKRFLNPERSNDLPDCAAMWKTPKASDGAKGGPNQRGSKGDLALPSQAMWATPKARDSKAPNPPSVAPLRMETESRGLDLPEQISGISNGSIAPMESGGQLNPEFVCWLMGFPVAWERSRVTATPSSRKSRRNL